MNLIFAHRPLDATPSVIDDRLPLYQRLKDEFVRRIRAGTWGTDGPIPSEHQLAQSHGVAVGTVRKAIEALVADGMLVRRQGSGTYVRRADFGNALFRFFRYTDASGQTLRPRGEMLSVCATEAPATIATHLGIQEGAPVIRMHRRRWVDEEPIVFEEIHVDARRFAPLLELPLSDFGDLLYPLYERRCGLRVFRARETIRFGLADDAVAANLGCADGDPVAVIERTASAIDDDVLEWRRSFGLAHKFSYSIELR